MPDLRRSVLLLMVLTFAAAPARSQMMQKPADDTMNQPDAATDDQPAPPVDPAMKAAHDAAAQKLISRTKSAGVPDTPLNVTERAQQMLNRFTFGARPGDLQQMIATTPQKWFEQQLHPAQINDSVAEKRIANDFPALALSPKQMLDTYPNRTRFREVIAGTFPMPDDPIEHGLYETLLYKYTLAQDKKDANGNIIPKPLLTEDEIAQKKTADTATAARIAGELFALPKHDRLPALMKVPVEDRVAFSTYVTGDQKRDLLAEATPHEREIFYALGTNDATFVLIKATQESKLERMILSERQLQEVMTDFWFNHFNIYIDKESDRLYTSDYERNAIRAHALGKFHDLLLATAESPAMMVYLDNWLSVGPDAPINGKKGKRGLNENYGREVMELHTISVNGGYSQADVTQLSRMLTGWTVDHPEDAGPFLYNPKMHEPGEKQWLGQTVPEDGQNEGLHALETLAASPKCAHFISWLIAQRFVADDPPPALVDRMTKTYLSTGGDITAILRTLVASPEFNSHKYFRNKVKTPQEFIASTFRSTLTDPANPAQLVSTLNHMGMPLYYALPPTGYYVTAEQWMNSAALIDRMNYAISLTRSQVGGMKFDAPALLARALMAQPAISRQGTGTDDALAVLEGSLLGTGVSERTSQFLHQQGAQPQKNTIDQLNQLTALILGSPEFQMR